MARIEITSPSGEKFEINAPDDATDEQIMAYAQENFKAPEKAPTEFSFKDTAIKLAKNVGNQLKEGLLNPTPGSLISLPARATQDAAKVAGESVENATGSKAAGVAANIALDPTTYVGAGAAGKAMGKLGTGAVESGVAKTIGQEITKIASGVSNVSMQAIRKLFSDPMSVIKAGSSKEAGQILQTAKKVAGVTREEEFLIAKAADRGTGGARTVGEALRPRFEGLVKDGAELSVGELMALNRAAGKLSIGASGSEKALWSGVAKNVKKALEAKVPDIVDGLEKVSMAKTKEAFKSVVPVTKAGRADYMKLIGTFLTAGLTSPAAIGLGTLATKGATKLVSPLAKASGFGMGAILNDSSKRGLDTIKERLRNAAK